MTENRSLTTTTYLITGATSGIGLATAKALARQGGTIVMVGHRPEGDKEIVASVQRESDVATIAYLQADLSIQADVRALAAAFVQQFPRLDVLINNVGGYYMGRRESADGIEMTLALNYLNVFLLTCLLLDSLRAGAPARIVNVASVAHRSAAFRFADPQGKRRYRGFRAYAQSKTAMIMVTYEFARRLTGTGVSVNAVHPGLVGTRLYRHLGFASAFVEPIIGWLAKSPEEGASTVVHLATDPVIAEMTGAYFANGKCKRSAPYTYDEVAARRLWEWTVGMVGCGNDAVATGIAAG
jgi:retinol dehydrogenase-12